MAHSQGEDEELLLLDLVDGAVVTGPDSPLARTPDKPSRGWRPRLDSEKLEHTLDLPTHLRIELAQLARSRRGQADVVPHAEADDARLPRGG